jgi:hypothetical protein
MWSVQPVELSSNMRGKVNGVCGNYNGNPNDEDIHDDVTDILPHDNLFYTLELITPPEEDTPFVDLSSRFDSYMKEQCEGEVINNLNSQMIYKRQGGQAAHRTVRDRPVSLVKLVKRDTVTAEAAIEMCEEAVSSNVQLLAVSSLIEANPALASYVVDLEVLVEEAITACAYDVQAIDEGAVGGLLNL